MNATAKVSLQSDDVKYIQEKARLLRIHSLRATTAAGSGHPTSCLSAAELVAATFFHAMKFDVADPNAISERSVRFVQGTCGAGALCGAGGSRSVSGFKIDDPAHVEQRIGRTSDAADSGRGCGDGIAWGRD